MSAFLLPNAGGGQLPDRVRHGRLVYIYTPHIKMCQFENISYNSVFHAQKQSSGNWLGVSSYLMIAFVHERLSGN